MTWSVIGWILRWYGWGWGVCLSRVWLSCEKFINWNKSFVNLLLIDWLHMMWSHKMFLQMSRTCQTTYLHDWWKGSRFENLSSNLAPSLVRAEHQVAVLSWFLLHLEWRLHRVRWRELRTLIAHVNSHWFSAWAVLSRFLLLAH